MAKHTPSYNKHTANAADNSAPKWAQVIELTQKQVADNLDAAAKKIHQEEAALEKDKARLEQIEQAAEAAERNIDQQIKQKKDELAHMPAPAPVKIEVKEEKKGEDSKKWGKWDFNPLNWARHIGTRALSGVVAFPARVAAKVKHIVARPQQLVSKHFYKDMWKNIVKTPKAILTTISGAMYKPHRDIVKFEDNFKDYGPEFANPTDKSKVVRFGKKALWAAGKVAAPAIGGLTAPVTGGISLLPKFFANIGRGMNHALVEFAEGIRDSKWHWNPKNWNLKPWKFSKTKEAFAKAFSKDRKGVSAPGTKIDITHYKEEHKKAA